MGREKNRRRRKGPLCVRTTLCLHSSPQLFFFFFSSGRQEAIWPRTKEAARRRSWRLLAQAEIPRRVQLLSVCPPQSGMRRSSPRMSCCGDKYLHLCCHSGNYQPVNFLLPDIRGPKNKPSVPPPPPRCTIHPQSSLHPTGSASCYFALCSSSSSLIRRLLP